MDLVFNELSLTMEFADIAATRESMNRFVSTIKAARVAHIGGPLRVPENFFTHPLSDGYTIAHWQYDEAVPKESRLYLGVLATKSPYLENLFGDPVADKFDRSEFSFDGALALGLGVAYLLDGLCISCSNAVPWNTTLIAVQFHVIDEVSCEILSRPVEVRHASDPAHIVVHATDIRTRRLAAVDSGSALWSCCSETFMRLQFCPAVEAQVRALTMGAGGVSLVLRAFRELQEVCDAWTEGPFDSSTIPNTTRDGEATLRQFGEERTFVGPDGSSEIFSWHVKRGALRIYFSPKADNHTCLIGYVGPHLRTVRYRK